MSRTIVIAAVLTVLVFGSCVQAQAPVPPEVTILACQQPVRIDGELGRSQEIEPLTVQTAVIMDLLEELDGIGIFLEVEAHFAEDS